MNLVVLGVCVCGFAFLIASTKRILYTDAKNSKRRVVGDKESDRSRIEVNDRFVSGEG